MDERRQRYLEAMGIPLWVRRDAPAPAGASHAPAGPDPAPPGASTVEAVVSSPPPAMAPPAGAGPQDWAGLEAQVAGCTACELHRTRNRTVFGVGSHEARLMVVGEAPGADEDRQGEPFVGRAGQLLNAMLGAIGYERAQVFIANVLKCRPPGNRDPRPEEAATCEPFLRSQILWIRPRVILAVGRVAAQHLLHTSEPLGRMRGRQYTYEDTGVPVIVTYHPAYLLRSPLQKRKAWDDLVLARRLAETTP